MKHLKVWLIPFVMVLSIGIIKAQKKPLVVFVCGDHEYSGELTMPILAQELQKNYNMECVVLKASPDQNAEENIPGLEILQKADLAVFFLRWRRLPKEQLAHIESYLNSKKPIMGFRTSTHSFKFPEGHPDEKWNEFGEWAFNSPPGWNKKNHHHYGHTSTTTLEVITAQAKHPVLRGVSATFKASSWLYNVLPDYPSLNSIPLILGTSVNSEKPNPKVNPVAWIGSNKYGAKVFFTTLGHPEDFKDPSMVRLCINAIHYQLGKKVPKKLKSNLIIEVPYRGIIK
ncbi:MAG: ThuA domain-containing protein [Leadbetterella sp.]